MNPVPDEATHHQRVADDVLYTYDQLVKRPFFERRATSLLDHVERIIPKGRLLDVGCGIGTELLIGKARGWLPVGIELAEGSVEIARGNGLTIIAQPLGIAPFEACSFDLVTINHALEHMLNVGEVLAEVGRVLRPEGLLFVAVPNVNAWKRFLMGERYGWTFNDDHFLHFSPASLRTLLHNSGFELLEVRTHRWADFQKKPIEAYPLPFRLLNRAIERAGLGIEIFALCRKRPDQH